MLLGSAELAALAPVGLHCTCNTPAVLQGKSHSNTTLDTTESSVAQADGKIRLLVFKLR